MKLLLKLLPLLVSASATAASWAPVIANFEGGETTPSGLWVGRPGNPLVWLDAADMRGRWIRVSYRTASPEADIRPMIDLFEAGENRPNRLAWRVPARCQPDRQAATSPGPRAVECTTEAWVPHQTGRIRILLWPANEVAPVRDLTVSRSTVAPVQPRAWMRTRALVDELADLFYWSDAVSWDKLLEDVNPAMAAPHDIDPVPWAVARIAAQLPHNSHMALVGRQGRVVGSSTAVLPRCESIGADAWKLWLPATPQRDEDHARYAEVASKCLLSSPSSRWVIDLRQGTMSGGSSDTMLLALAPLFDTGKPLVHWENRARSRFEVSLTSRGLLVRGSSQVRLNRQLVAAGEATPASVRVWIDRSCASACEVAAAALKGLPRVKLVGSRTAGKSTTNERLVINDEVQLFVTAGVLLDRAMNPVGDAVDPDIAYDGESSEDVLHLTSP